MTHDGKLTARWFDLPDVVNAHIVQQRLKDEFFKRLYRYYVVAAGRRSYKTERAKRWFVLMSMGQAGKRYFLGAPTRTQAKLLFWRDVLDLTPSYMFDGEPNKTDLVIRYKSGSELHVIGLEAYKRIEGIRWDGCCVSEYQEVDADFLSATLEPILNDTNGQAILEGRPIGRNHFYDDFRREGNGDPLWRSYTWPSADVLSPEQIAAAKRTLAEDDFRREYEADFEAGSSRVYYAYSIDNLRDVNLDMSKPVIVTCDFNATEKPMSWTIGQRDGENTYWIKSLVHRHTNTATMCERLNEYLGAFPSKPPALIFYGDFAGTKSTSNSSYSDWQIIEDAFRNYTRFEKRVKPCKSVRDRVAATNAQLCNAEGKRRQFVNPKGCWPLIEDWDRVQWKPNGIELDGSDDMRTHSSDSVDYYNDYENPVRGRIQYVKG